MHIAFCVKFVKYHTLMEAGYIYNINLRNIDFCNINVCNIDLFNIILDLEGETGN